MAAEDDDRRNSLRISIKQERLSEIIFAQPFQILKTRNFIELEYQRQMKRTRRTNDWKVLSRAGSKMRNPRYLMDDWMFLLMDDLMKRVHLMDELMFLLMDDLPTHCHTHH